MSFYVILPSDSSKNYFPNNSVSKFITYLPQALNFDGDYEVGLCEFSYPRTWNNVKQDCFMRVYTNVKPEDPEFILQRLIQIPPGNYVTVYDLLEMIEPDSGTGVVRFTYDLLSKRVSVELKTSIHLDMPTHKAMMLGFTLDNTGEFIRIESSTRAPYTVDMNVSLHSLFVYSDIVEKTIVGDSNSPLLRIVSVKGMDGETIDVVFSQPHYLPVAATKIQTIEVNIMDDTGNYVQFQRGKSHVALHFRPRRSWTSL